MRKKNLTPNRETQAGKDNINKFCHCQCLKYSCLLIVYFESLCLPPVTSKDCKILFLRWNKFLPRSVRIKSTLSHNNHVSNAQISVQCNGFLGRFYCVPATKKFCIILQCYVIHVWTKNCESSETQILLVFVEMDVLKTLQRILFTFKCRCFTQVICMKTSFSNCNASSNPLIMTIYNIVFINVSIGVSCLFSFLYFF